MLAASMLGVVGVGVGSGSDVTALAGGSRLGSAGGPRDRVWCEMVLVAVERRGIVSRFGPQL